MQRMNSLPKSSRLLALRNTGKRDYFTTCDFWKQTPLEVEGFAGRAEMRSMPLLELENRERRSRQARAPGCAVDSTCHGHAVSILPGPAEQYPECLPCRTCLATPCMPARPGHARRAMPCRERSATATCGSTMKLLPTEKILFLSSAVRKMMVFKSV